MDLSAPNFRHGLRQFAQRLGLPAFWRWWSGELRAVVPSRVRNALHRRRLRPVLVFHPDAAALWSPQPVAGGIAYVEATRIPLQGDAAQIAQAGRAAMDAIGGRRRSPGFTGPRIVIALTPAQVLRKFLTYPAAVEENLYQVLRYDLDRHTPFKTDELYYDAAIVGRNDGRNEIRIELVAALKSVVDPLRRHAAAWGAAVAAIAPELPRGAAATGAARLNLLPAAERTERTPWQRWQTWVPIGVVGILVLAAIAIPLLQSRASAIALLGVAEQARVQAAASDALRQQLEQAVGDYNFVLGRKYAFPSTVQVLDDVTRLLPDDTWLTQLELKSAPKGKDPHREILLRGESGNAGRLVTMLEESKLFEQAAPRSPTTKIQPGPGEIFDLGAQVKPSGLPSPAPLATGGNVAPTASPAATGPAPTAAAAASAGAVGSLAAAAPRRVPGAPAPAVAPSAGSAPGAPAAPSPPTTRPPASASAGTSAGASAAANAGANPASPVAIAPGAPPAGIAAPARGSPSRAQVMPDRPMPQITESPPPTFGPVSADGRTHGEGQ